MLAIIVECQSQPANTLDKILTQSGFFVERIQDHQSALLNHLSFVAPEILIFDVCPVCATNNLLEAVVESTEYKNTYIFVTTKDDHIIKQYSEKYSQYNFFPIDSDLISSFSSWTQESAEPPIVDQYEWLPELAELGNIEEDPIQKFVQTAHKTDQKITWISTWAG